MTTVRMTTKEVQVDSTIYQFDAVWKADAFEAYLAVADVEHCVKQHPPVGTRQVQREEPAPEAIGNGDSARDEA